MNQIVTPDMVEQRVTAPLRIFYDKEKRHFFTSPYELTEDDLIVKLLEPTIAHYQVVSVDFSGVAEGGFKRHFLYSKAQDKHIFTASGYLFDGDVRVVHDFEKAIEDMPDHAKSFGWKLNPEQQADADFMHNVEALNVRGDKKNESGGFNNVLRAHRHRISGLKVEELTLKDALDFYDRIRYNVPRY